MNDVQTNIVLFIFFTALIIFFTILRFRIFGIGQTNRKRKEKGGGESASEEYDAKKEEIETGYLADIERNQKPDSIYEEDSVYEEPPEYEQEIKEDTAFSIFFNEWYPKGWRCPHCEAENNSTRSVCCVCGYIRK